MSPFCRYLISSEFTAVAESTEELPCTGELLEEIRQGFEESRKFKDAYAMKYSLSNGRVQLKQLRDMLGMRL